VVHFGGDALALAAFIGAEERERSQRPNNIFLFQQHLTVPNVPFFTTQRDQDMSPPHLVVLQTSTEDKICVSITAMWPILRSISQVIEALWQP
jgi:hypothetical protein